MIKKILVSLSLIILGYVIYCITSRFTQKNPPDIIKDTSLIEFPSGLFVVHGRVIYVDEDNKNGFWIEQYSESTIRKLYLSFIGLIRKDENIQTGDYISALCYKTVIDNKLTTEESGMWANLDNFFKPFEPPGSYPEGSLKQHPSAFVAFLRNNQFFFTWAREGNFPLLPDQKKVTEDNFTAEKLLHEYILKGDASSFAIEIDKNKHLLLEDAYPWYESSRLHVIFARGKFEETHEQVADILLGNGCSVNSVDSYGRTPLHYASIFGNEHDSPVSYLLSKGADRNIIDKFGKKAEDYIGEY